MQFPFKVIESTTTTRNKFDTTDGYQPTHALFYLKKGVFEIETNGVKQKISKGDCYILPDFVYYHRNVIEPIEFVYVKFAFNERCPYTMEIPIGKVTFIDEKRFLTSITTLEQIMMTENPIYRGYQDHLLLDILFQIYHEHHSESTVDEQHTCYDEIVNAAITYINNSLNKKLYIEDICRNIGTNPSTLNFKFRREFNCSVGNYILYERIKKSKRLLIGSSYSIEEVARRCGFENVYYFSNTFKKHQGCAPSAYRKQKVNLS